GYSRAAQGQKPEQFWGVRQDAAAMGAFIRRYLDEAGRRDSPVYLVGESYGGFRAALLADKLQEDDGIAPSGIVLISPALDFSYIYGDSPLQWALSLPSMAAANFERQGLRGEKLRAELAKVEHYALTDYLVALASGLKEGGATASETVAGLTGLPLELVERHFARIPVQLFAREFDRAAGRVASPYDTGVSAPDIAPESARLVSPDPVLDRSIPAVTSAFVQYVREELKYRTPISYKLLNTEVTNAWDYGTSPSRQGYADAVDDLQKARALDPAMRILIANGLTDLVTPYSVTRYIVQHLPPLAGAEPIETRTYEGGHMMYFKPDGRKALKEAVLKFYSGMQ
ncbi:MAG: peptidase S10, partial [Rhizobiales bacterium]|nr:peptidase S10 [Hyphomicrobiales bacterium]